MPCLPQSRCFGGFDHRFRLIRQRGQEVQSGCPLDFVDGNQKECEVPGLGLFVFLMLLGKPESQHFGAFGISRLADDDFEKSIWNSDGHLVFRCFTHVGPWLTLIKNWTCDYPYPHKLIGPRGGQILEISPDSFVE